MAFSAMNDATMTAMLKHANLPSNGRMSERNPMVAVTMEARNSTSKWQSFMSFKATNITANVTNRPMIDTQLPSVYELSMPESTS